MQLEHNQLASPQTLGPVVSSTAQEYDMDFLFDPELDQNRPGTIISPQTFPSTSEETYPTPFQPTLVAPVSVPAQPVQPPVSQDRSLPEVSFGGGASQLHDRYNSHRINTTSGDLSTLGSALFSEDSPPPGKATPSRINHYVTVELLPLLETNLQPVRRSKAPLAKGHASQLHESSEPPDTPVLEGGIDSFCMRSFPHDVRLQEALRTILLSKKPGEAQNLHKFLESCEGKWKCRFAGDSGPCEGEFKRRDKAVGHILQVHIKMLPIPCNGDCGVPKW